MPRVTEEDLASHGRTEVVQVVVPLTNIVAEDEVPEIKKLLSPFGEAVAMRPNTLILQDTVGNLQRILDILHANGKQDVGTLVYQCLYVRAQDAATILEKQLGDRAKENAPTMVMMQGGGGPGGGGGGPGGGGMRAFPVMPTGKQSRPYYVSVEERNNKVLVSGPQDVITRAENILKQIDKGEPGQGIRPQPGPYSLKTYAVSPGTAEAVAKQLSEVYKLSPTIRIAPVGANSVMVYATFPDHVDIATLVEGVRPTPEPKNEIISIKSVDVNTVVTNLIAVFGDQKAGGPYMAPDPSGRNAIVVRGTPQQVTDVKTFLKDIDEASIASGNMRSINLRQGSGVSLAEELGRMFKERGFNVDVIIPGATETARVGQRQVERQARQADRR